ncbi:MAG TPA: tannase/feruloyl esterase family alpha/beta hydrolase, partial [Steroidobacteraceae bacterium]
MMIPKFGRGVVALAGALLGVSHVACADTPATKAAQACAALVGFRIPASAIGLPTTGATVEKAVVVPPAAGDTTGGEYCAVGGTISPVSSSAPGIEFQVNLPSHWNEKALQMGGGGYDGTLVPATGLASLQPADTPTPLQQGYVTLGSDGGHKGGPGFDGRFGLNDEALLNYGKESVKK